MVFGNVFLIILHTPFTSALIVFPFEILNISYEILLSKYLLWYSISTLYLYNIRLEIRSKWSNSFDLIVLSNDLNLDKDLYFEVIILIF